MLDSAPWPSLARRFATGRGVRTHCFTVMTALLGFACASQTAASSKPFRAQDTIHVPYPPPAALPEVVPDAPEQADAVWVDGSWHWRGDMWIWHRGGWLQLVEGAHHEPSRLSYAEDGALYWTEPRWFDSKGKLFAPKLIEPAGYPPTPRAAESAAVP